MSVDIFNKLPRSRRSPSGRVPNVWHFDIRYVQLQPPSHMVFLLQPESSFVHTEMLPIGQPHGLGFAFFPDTAKEAAVEIARALIHAFVSSLGASKFEKNPPPPYAPWAFTTDDLGLSKEVGAELKRLGVKAPELCDVKFVPKLTEEAHAAYKEVFESMKKMLRMNDMACAAFTAPSGISFSYFKLAPWVEPKSDEMEAAVAYSQRLSSARPLTANRELGDFTKEIQATMELLRQRRSATVRAEADAGNPQAGLEYSVRLQYGIQCAPSRALCRQYLIKVITNNKADDTMKSIAHSLLIDWYVQAFEDGQSAARYVHAAAHSADEAVRLASGLSSPAVLFFARHVLEKHASVAVELYAQYKHVWEAKDRREAEMAKANNKATLKRMKQPNRYMCANVDCPVSSDSGHMLQQCAGKCDQDKKPSYCGKDCQRADWKNHKPFCRPGAPCSVIERPDAKIKGHSSTKDGALKVPITNPDGTTTFISSSTMSSKMLKKMKAQAEAGGGLGFTRGITVGISKIRVGDGDDSDSEESDSESD
ncbi:hypothetical protein B0H17DRAFT_1215856 [Mycena rosella]|uniref:MYND-type domain-containing protein n=1 Tax=Mycena rosella TaxID=1033263 RepID=A0AAD7CDH1_MYCRO|nr:hypothetical protein B0H17DRAFT_1215856 [Mycena rosella]